MIALILFAIDAVMVVMIAGPSRLFKKFYHNKAFALSFLCSRLYGLGKINLRGWMVEETK